MAAKKLQGEAWVRGLYHVHNVQYSFHSNCPLVRFIQYNPTSLERSHRHELLTEVDLGVPINLILPETYTSHDSGGMFGGCYIYTAMYMYM